MQNIGIRQLGSRSQKEEIGFCDQYKVDEERSGYINVQETS